MVPVFCILAHDIHVKFHENTFNCFQVIQWKLVFATVLRGVSTNVYKPELWLLHSAYFHFDVSKTLYLITIVYTMSKL